MAWTYGVLPAFEGVGMGLVAVGVVVTAFATVLLANRWWVKRKEWL